MSIEGARTLPLGPSGSKPGHRGPAAAVPAAHVALALVTVYVLWGSTYLAMRLAIATSSKSTLTCLAPLIIPLSSP